MNKYLSIKRYLSEITAGALLLASLLIAVNSAEATKGGPVVPVRMRVTKPVVAPGDSFIYVISATNGKKQATGVMIAMEVLPAGVTCSNIVQGTTCTLKAGKLSCNPSILAPYQAISVQVECKVAANVRCGSTLTSQVGLWANKEDSRAVTTQTVQCARPTPTPTVAPTRTPVPTPVSTPVSTPVVTAECSDRVDNDNDGLVDFPADSGCTGPTDDSEDSQLITITKTVARTVVPGALVKYSYRVTNIGPRTITGVSVEDFNINNSTLLPIDQVFQYERATNAACSHNQGSKIVFCTLGNLSSGESRVFDIYFRVPAGNSMCNLDVMNQADVYEASQNPNYINWTKAVTRVSCGATPQCSHNGAYYFDNGYTLLNSRNIPGDPIQTQAFNVVSHYQLTTDGNFRSTWGVNRGYSGMFWYRSNYFLQRLTPANRSWMYLDPKTGIIRLWIPSTTNRPEDDIFIAQLGGGLDACGVCGGNASSCQPR